MYTALNSSSLRLLFPIDISKLQLIMKQLQETVDKDGLLTYAHLKLTIAVIAVKTGFIRPGKISGAPTHIANVSPPQV